MLTSAGISTQTARCTGTQGHLDILVLVESSVRGPEASFQLAEQLFNASIKENPKQASALNSLSHLYLNKGWVSEAKHATETAYSIDHYLTDVERTIWRLVTISYDLGNSQETKRWCKEGLSRFPDDFRFSKGMIMVNGMPGIEPNIEECWTFYEQAKQNIPTYDSLYQNNSCLQLMAMVLSKANLTDSARNVSFRGKAKTYHQICREDVLDADNSKISNDRAGGEPNLRL